MSTLETFVQNYIAVWNEPDAERRRALIRTLWQDDASHLARTLEAIGHAGIEKRVTDAYDKWVREKGNVFRLRDGVDGHHGTVKLRWEMLPASGGAVISIGFRLHGGGRRRPHPHRLPVHRSVTARPRHVFAGGAPLHAE